MVSTEEYAGRPGKFHFGQTRFLDLNEASGLLGEVFSPVRDDNAGVRLVILIGHAVDNDTEMIKQHFGIDTNAKGNICYYPRHPGHCTESRNKAPIRGFGLTSKPPGCIEDSRAVSPHCRQRQRLYNGCGFPRRGQGYGDAKSPSIKHTDSHQ